MLTATPEVPEAAVYLGVALRPDPGSLLPLVWAKLDDIVRRPLEVERRRSADLLSMMRHHHAAGHRALVAALVAYA